MVWWCDAGVLAVVPLSLPCPPPSLHACMRVCVCVCVCVRGMQCNGESNPCLGQSRRGGRMDGYRLRAVVLYGSLLCLWSLLGLVWLRVESGYVVLRIGSGALYICRRMDGEGRRRREGVEGREGGGGRSGLSS
jgi:hypothetical protein